MCQAAEISHDDKQVLPVGGRKVTLCETKRAKQPTLGSAGALLPKKQLSGCNINASTHFRFVTYRIVQLGMEREIKRAHRKCRIKM